MINIMGQSVKTVEQVQEGDVVKSFIVFGILCELFFYLRYSVQTIML